MHLINHPLAVHPGQREQRVVERKATPAPGPVPVLLEEVNTGGQSLSASRQAARCQMAPDRRRTSPTSEEAPSSLLRFGLSESIIHGTGRPTKCHPCLLDVNVKQKQCPTGFLSKYVTGRGA